MNLISCKNVSFAYDNVVTVKDLNFNIECGDYFCIVGQNGSGKSTLLKGLLNLKKPYTGIVETHNQLSPREIGYLPQQTTIQKDFPASAFEVVLSGCLNRLGFRPFYSRNEKNIAEHNMERLGIGHLKNKCYRELSGGQQQRVLLARALCATKKAILLDEPVAGLDPVISHEMYGLIQTINKEGITVIMVSHDISSTLKYAKHILHLHHTQLFFGTVPEYQNSDIGRRFIGKETYVEPDA